MEVDNHLKRLLQELSWIIFSEDVFNAKFSHDSAKEKMAEINRLLIALPTTDLTDGLNMNTCKFRRL